MNQYSDDRIQQPSSVSFYYSTCNGPRNRTRTHNQAPIESQLYQLSYTGEFLQPAWARLSNFDAKYFADDPLEPPVSCDFQAAERILLAISLT